MYDIGTRHSSLLTRKRKNKFVWAAQAQNSHILAVLKVSTNTDVTVRNVYTNKTARNFETGTVKIN